MNRQLLVLMAMIAVLLTACKKDPPTLTIADSASVKVGETLRENFTFTADAGLSTVTASITSGSGTATIEDLSGAGAEEGSGTLVFVGDEGGETVISLTIEDEKGETASTSITITNTLEDPPAITELTTSADADALIIDGGTELTINLSFEADGGIATIVGSADQGTVSDAEGFSAGETSGSATLTYTAPEVMEPTEVSVSITLTDGQAIVGSTDTTFTVVIAPAIQMEYNNIKEFLDSRPEFSDLNDLVVRADLGLTLADPDYKGTFFAVPNGAFDDWFPISQFHESIGDLGQAEANNLVNLLRNRFRLRNVPDGMGGTFTTTVLPFDSLYTTTYMNRTGEMNNRNYLKVAFTPDNGGQAGYLDKDGNPTFIANFTVKDIMINPVDGEPTAIVHVLDRLWIDFSVFHNDLLGSIESVKGLESVRAGGMATAFLGVPSHIWNPVNSLDNPYNYSGTESWRGTIFVPKDAIEVMNSLVNTPVNATNTDGTREIWNWPANVCSADDPGDASTCAAWWPGPDCGCYVPDADFTIMQDFWKNHVIYSDTWSELQDGALGDGTYTNAAGESITLAGSSVTANGRSATILKTVHYFDGSGGFGAAGLLGQGAPQAYVDDADANGGVYRTIHIIDTALK